MNDWEIKKFLKVVLAIQIVLWGTIGLDAVGLEIPIIRQFIGFIYLTFIPGIIILRILKLHRLGFIETLLYTVGLSIATLMFTGFLMNMFYPLFGISKPISIKPLISTISVIVLVFCAWSYIRDKSFSTPSNSSNINYRGLLSPPALVLCLLPFLAILGTYSVNFYQNNIILMLLIAIIALIVVLVAFDKFIPERLYPLAVFTIGLSLLFHYSLISMYLFGADIFLAQYLANLVLSNSFWEPIHGYSISGMLSIVMLTPIYSQICGLEPTWIFKIIYPALYALVPLGLYRVFQKQTSDKIAFLSCFFFMAYWYFYMGMPDMARCIIAEIFIVSLLLLIIDPNMPHRSNKKALLIIFALSIIVSHYGYTYFFMFMLIIAWGILSLNVRFQKQKLIGTLTVGFILIFIVFAFIWYNYIVDTALVQVTRIVDRIVANLFSEFGDVAATQGLHIATAKCVSPLHEIHKYFHLVSQFFIGVGIIMLLLKRSYMKFKEEFAVFSIIGFVICISCITVPNFAGYMNTNRIYHFALIFLAPFFVIGGITVFNRLDKIVRISSEAVQQFKVGRKIKTCETLNPKTNKIFSTGSNFGADSSESKISLRLLAIFLVVYLLLNSGFIYEVANDNPSSLALSSHNKDSSCRNKMEDFGAQWLSLFSNDNYLVYGDPSGRLIVKNYIKNYAGRVFTLSQYTQRPEKAYIYLRSWNIMHQEILTYNVNKTAVDTVYLKIRDTLELSNMLNAGNTIYDNGGCQILEHKGALI